MAARTSPATKTSAFVPPEAPQTDTAWATARAREHVAAETAVRQADAAAEAAARQHAAALHAGLAGWSADLTAAFRAVETAWSMVSGAPRLVVEPEPGRWAVRSDRAGLVVLLVGDEDTPTAVRIARSGAWPRREAALEDLLLTVSPDGRVLVDDLDPATFVRRTLEPLLTALGPRPAAVPEA
jgi:hypothetical protein